MKFKKAIALATTGILAASMLAACTGTASSSSSATTSTSTGTAASAATTGGAVSGKLTFGIWDLSATDYWNDIIAAFQTEYPEVEVEIVDTPAADYTNKLTVDLNGGAAPDVFLIKDADTTYSLSGKNQLEDLSSYVTESGADLSAFNGLEQNFIFDGVQAGLPFRTDYYVMYYNKDIFDAAGVEYPSNDMTWPEFEALAKELTSGEGANKNYGAHFHTWQALVENWGVQGGENTIMGPDYEFMRDSYEMVLRMQNDDKSIQDYATLKTGNIAYGSAFQTGNVAMMPMGTWYATTHIDKVATGETEVVNWGIATIPHWDGQTAGETVGSTTPIAINAASKNKDAAWAFVEFVTMNPTATTILAEAGGIPATVNDEMLKVITSLEGMPEGSEAALKTTKITLDRPYVNYVNEVNTMLGEEHGLVMLGEETIDEFITNVTERSKTLQAG